MTSLPGAAARRAVGALAEWSDEDYGRFAPVQWPLHRAGTGSVGTNRLCDNRSTIPAEDGRACFIATRYRPLAEPSCREWPLVLNTGRVRDQWHTMTQTGRVPGLMTHCSEPLLDIHPADAGRLGLAASDLARVESRHGATVLPVRLSTEQRSGEVFAPMHWTDSFTSAGPVCRLVGAVTDPVSGQPELKGTPVRVTPLATFWHGRLLRQTETRLAEGPFYWARIPLNRGQMFALAGWEPLPSGQGADAWILELLEASPTADLITYADPGHGAFRYASIADGRLDACLLLARRAAELPASETLVAALGTEISPDMRLWLLAGRTNAALDDGARTICICFGVGLGTLRHENIRPPADQSFRDRRRVARRHELRVLHPRADGNPAQCPARKRAGILGEPRMVTDNGFTEDQRQYLEAFIVGIANRRGLSLADGATSASAHPYPADPMAIHYEAQDRAVAAGRKLAAEEVAKREKHPFDMWDEIAANAAAGRFPKGLDVFRHKFHGLFYVAPNQDAFMTS